MNEAIQRGSDDLTLLRYHHFSEPDSQEGLMENEDILHLDLPTPQIDETKDVAKV